MTRQSDETTADAPDARDAADATDPAPASLLISVRVAALLLSAVYVLGVVAGIATGYLGSQEAPTLQPEAPPFLPVLTNNIGVVSWLAAGALTCGLATAAVILLNASLHGWLIGVLWRDGMIDVMVTGVLPHGILEMVAYVVAGAASVSAGVALVGWLGDRRRPLMPWGVWLRYQGVAVVLLAVAAAIESLVSHV